MLPLNDDELLKLVRLAYPEKFCPDETHDTDCEVWEFIDSLTVRADIADLLGRVIELTLPVESNLSGTAYYAFGKISMDPEARLVLIDSITRPCDLDSTAVNAFSNFLENLRGKDDVSAE